jgi:ABC-type transport system involved in multi-copper enzyme maturation permease subunit
MFDPRLIAADILKLRRRRGMLSISLFLTLGGMALVFIVMAVQHGVDPARYGPAGGLENYREDMSFLGLMALVVGAIVGATAGTQDLESGVFRDLAATGRSRTALFASRVMGAWAVVLPILALAAGVTGAASVALAGSLAAPSAGALVAGTASVLAAAALGTAMAVGLSVLVGSRGPVIGILLAFYLAIQPLLLAMSLLGTARQLIPEAALNRIGDLPSQAGDLHVALVTAIVVVVAWAAAALGLGAWRTRTREI